LKNEDEFPIDLAAERALDRRGFLRLAAVSAGAVAATERFLHVLPWPLAATASTPLRLDDLEELAPGEARSLPAGDGTPPALLVRVDAATLVAFDRRCPHLGCPVLWSKEHRRFECPCHDAAFDARTGRVLFGPPRRGLAPLAIAS
jgi:nitrite reductase/ring-hydroxylating ferredoxin subunit